MASRTGRIYGAHELSGARSSTVSLASNTTGVSHSSWGSGTTVTRDLQAKSRRSNETRRKPRKKDDNLTGLEKALEPTANEEKNAEVFEFMVGTKEYSSLSPDLEKSVLQNNLQLKESSTEQRAEIDLENYYRAHLTDSGVAMEVYAGDSHLDIQAKQPLSPLIEEATDQSVYNDYHRHGLPATEPVFHHDPQMWSHYPAAPYTPEPVPLSPASIRSYAYPADYTYRGTPDLPSTGDSSLASSNSAPLIFTDRAGKKVKNPQLFRSFAKTSQKVLLQMQANIAELEQELLSLDGKAVVNDVSPKLRHRKGEHGHGPKQSRKDQIRRADLYHELRSSLEQYYDTLASFHRISQLAVPGESADMASLKSWLKYNVVPSVKVAGLTGDGSDLVRLGSHHADLPDETLRVTAYCVFADVVIPLLLFKLVSGVLTRLVLLSLITCLTIVTLDRYRTRPIAELGQLYSRCIIGCVGISLTAALLF